MISCHPAIAGAAAGIALVALDERYGESADRADVASATLIVVGTALAVSAVGQGESARQAVAVYWIIVVVAALPLSVDAWRERRRQRDALRIMAERLAGRDYRGEKKAPPACEH